MPLFICRWLKYVLVALCFTLSSCSAWDTITSNSKVLPNRYSVAPLGRNTYIVSYSGVPYVPAAHVDHVLLMKAAELTKESGNTFFMLFPLSYITVFSKNHSDQTRPLLYKCQSPEYCKAWIVKIITHPQPDEPMYNANVLLKLVS